MRHRQGEIVFVVKRSRDKRDGPARDQFLDKNHAAPPAVVRFAADIKTQIDLFKMAMEGNGKSANAAVPEKKPDEADIGFTVPEIQFRPCRDKGYEGTRVNFVIEHGQPAPFGGE